MSLVKSIFQKDLYELTIADISSFFETEQEESSVLEFKSGKVELEDIYREVSAFLNTEGGILIIGTPYEKKTGSGIRERKVCVGELVPSPFKSQDSLIRSIASNISPSPTGVKIKQLYCGDGSVYIIDIPQSFNPPHQVNNEGKYYIRLERDCKPAPHGIVEALFFKRQKPNLELGINIHTLVDNPNIFIEIRLTNESLVTAEHAGIMIIIDGIKEIVNSQNIGNAELKDGKISFQEAKLPILVKNLNAFFKFEIIPSQDFLLIETTFWCKDLQAESKIVIYDLKEPFKILKIYNSKEHDRNSAKEVYTLQKNLKESYDEATSRIALTDVKTQIN